jgi:uncharacterized protein DUF3160
MRMLDRSKALWLARWVGGLCLVVLLVPSMTACGDRSLTPTIPTPTRDQAKPTRSPTATSPARGELFQTYAHGELLPDMRVPIQRSEGGEGGWYTVIDNAEGWAQFLSQMGQPAEIWEPLSWGQEIVIGALLGVRSGRGHAITITDVEIDGIGVQVSVQITAPQPETAIPSWISYPFHFVRIARDELPLGPVNLSFVGTPDSEPDVAGQVLVRQVVDVTALNILWLPGEAALYPTPTALPSTSTPEPTLTATPVPNLQTMGTVLEVIPDALTLRLLPDQGDWMYVNLMEATSILFQDGQTATVSQILPGMTINVLGYRDEGGTMRAAHIDVLSLATETPDFVYHSREASLSTLYGGYSLPLPVESISTTALLSDTFSVTQTRVLTQSGFMIVPATYQSFGALYADAQHAGTPSFVSADLVLDTSSQLLSQIQASVEQRYQLPELRMLDREMYDLSWAQYLAMEMSATPAEQRIATTALRNAAYFAVPLSLLDPAFELPQVISPVVHAELSLIAASDSITISPLLDLPGMPDAEKQQVDYTRFTPLSHYAANDALARYFQALTWHREIVFRPSQREETRSAALIAYTMNQHPATHVLWERIQSVLAFFQGQGASYTPAQYGDLIEMAWAESAEITALGDEVQFDALTLAIGDLSPPDNPIWTFWIRNGFPERGWQFLSTPFWIDMYVFEQMTGDHVGDEGNPRDLPLYIDLASVLGSPESYVIADKVGESEIAHYLDQVGKVRNELSSLQLEHWTADLHWNWLHAHSAVIREKTTSYPEWMRTASWRRKDLQSVFGSWTILRRDAGAAFLEAPTPEPAAENTPSVSWGYVEPQPELYARLAALVRQIIDGLDNRLMLSSADRSALLAWEEWLIFVQDAARRELTGQTLLPEEYQRLGADALVLQGATLNSGPQGATAVRLAASETEQLIEATGRVDEIYVVIERGGDRFLARGGVYSHYEFVWPVEESLTVSRWQEMLDTEEMPARSPWVQAFILE